MADGTNPYNAETNYYLGTAHKTLGETSKAMQYWEKSLSYDINFIPTNKSVGIYYYNKNLYDSASSYLARIIDQDNSLTTLYYLIKANLQKGDSAKALEYFNKYKSRHDYYSLNNFIESIEDKKQ